jgi:hypothetical protein
LVDVLGQELLLLLAQRHGAEAHGSCGVRLALVFAREGPATTPPWLLARPLGLLRPLLLLPLLLVAVCGVIVDDQGSDHLLVVVDR